MKSQVLKIYQGVTKTEPSFIMMKPSCFLLEIFQSIKNKDGPLNISFSAAKEFPFFMFLLLMSSDQHFCCFIKSLLK